MEEVIGFVVCVPATLIATISPIKRLPDLLRFESKSKPLVRGREREREGWREGGREGGTRGEGEGNGVGVGEGEGGRENLNTCTCM